jgi:hypothetical protein
MISPFFCVITYTPDGQKHTVPSFYRYEKKMKFKKGDIVKIVPCNGMCAHGSNEWEPRPGQLDFNKFRIEYAHGDYAEQQYRIKHLGSEGNSDILES